MARVRGQGDQATRGCIVSLPGGFCRLRLQGVIIPDFSCLFQLTRAGAGAVEAREEVWIGVFKLFTKLV